MNIAIIVAAGSGSRFGANIPKQFAELGGKPVIARCLDTFEATSAINEIVVVASTLFIETVEAIGLDFRISKLSRVVEGAETRAGSVKNGFDAIDRGSGVVLVHDAARPFVHVSEIEEIVDAAQLLGAACLVGEVADTIKEVEQDRVVKTVDRSRLRRALTPQGFRVEILRRALDEHFDPQATDECSLVETFASVGFVEGSARNLKITREEDLILAEALLAKYSNEGLTGCLE